MNTRILIPRVYSIYAKLYLAGGGSKEVTLASSASFPSAPSVLSMDVSPGSIAAKASVAMSSLLAYDVYGRVSGLDSQNRAVTEDWPLPQRFVVKRYDGRIREFLFVNTLGVVESVFSAGSLTRSLEREAVLFIQDRKETEVTIDATEKFRTDSGYLESSEEVDLWMDFLASREHYILQDGSPVAIIIDEVATDFLTGELGSVQFTWHFTNVASGRYREKTIIDNYTYDEDKL